MTGDRRNTGVGGSAGKVGMGREEVKMEEELRGAINGVTERAHLEIISFHFLSDIKNTPVRKSQLKSFKSY